MTVTANPDPTPLAHLRRQTRVLRRAAGFWLLGTLVALACRYSVRDTGFVDLGAEPYRLVLDAPAQIAAALPATVRTGINRALEDSNMEWSLRVAPTPDSDTVLSLSDATGRKLVLGKGEALGKDSEALLRLVQSAATSRRREELYENTLQAYAVMVVIEGSDTAEAEWVKRIADAASGTLQRLMPSMPKPVDTPPKVLVIPTAQQAAETVLIWGLGFDPAPATETRLAIVYGRGRRLGSTLEGPTITRTALQERLALIGQDCECDLDRAWLKGPVIPGRWARDLQQTASRLLGFDPENPLVRTEVSRIVLRGEGDRTRSRKTTSVLGLGYTEESIDATGGDAAVAGDAEEPRVAGGGGSGGPESRASTNATAAASPAAPGSATAGSEPTKAPSSGRGSLPMWLLLGGTFGASVFAGLWVASRNSRKHG